MLIPPGAASELGVRVTSITMRALADVSFGFRNAYLDYERLTGQRPFRGATDPLRARNGMFFFLLSILLIVVAILRLPQGFTPS